MGCCGISPRVTGFEGIGQVMQRRRERKRQYGPPASIQPAARQKMAYGGVLVSFSNGSRRLLHVEVISAMVPPPPLPFVRTAALP